MKTRSTVFLLSYFSLFVLSLSFCGCSLFHRNDATPEEKLAVIRVCDEYLRNIAQGNYAIADGMIAWAEYKPLKEGGVTRAFFTERIVANKGRWSVQAHPLLGVDVVEASIEGDSADMVLQKKGASEPIKIELAWAGRGWIIIDDNIFTEKGPYH